MATQYLPWGSRVFELIFWVGSFKELAHESWSGSHFVLLSQLAHLVIMADFFYYYFISIVKGHRWSCRRAIPAPMCSLSPNIILLLDLQ